MRMSKSEKVLDYRPDLSVSGHEHYFSGEQDDPNQITTGLFLTELDFMDFGSPKQVTVTIVPGDTLNQENN